MKFLDKKNRLFGKIHVAFLLLPIFLIFISLLVWQVVTSKPDYVLVRVKGSPGNWWWVTPRPPDWLVSSIKPGDKEYNTLGRTTAEIITVNIYDAGGPTKDIYLMVKIAAKLNKRTQRYRYKGEPLVIGGPISLELSKTLFPGIIVDIRDIDSQEEKKTVEKILTVRQFDRWPWGFDAIKVGEKMTTGEGEVIAEILDKWKVPAEKEAYTDTGKILKTYSPIRYDFFIKLKIKAVEEEGELIFREEQYLKVSNYIWVMFPNYNISGAEIVAIQEVQ